MLSLRLPKRPSRYYRSAISLLWNWQQQQQQQQYQHQRPYRNCIAATITSSSTTATAASSSTTTSSSSSSSSVATATATATTASSSTTIIPFHIDPSSWTQPIQHNERRSYETIQALIRQRVYERETYMINTHFDDHQNPTQRLSVFQLMQKVINQNIPSQQELDVMFPIQPMDWDTLQQFNSNSVSDSPHASSTTSSTTPTTPSQSSNTNIQITWMGHSTVLIQYPNGINVITDPIFAQYCSPIQGFGPKRYRPPPCTIQDLLQHIPIHLVVLSHNHYDHLDYTTIKAILQHNNSRIQTQFVVPLGLQDWFHRTFSKNILPPIYELDWYEYMEYSSQKNYISEPTISSSAPTNDDEEDTNILRIRSIPMKHWSNRYMYDRDRSLWCGYSIEYVSSSSSQQGTDGRTTKGSSAPTRTSSNNTTSTITTTADDGSKFLFMGDTGYYDAMITTNCLLGPYNYAAIPIGAYEPRSFMKHHHMNVMEAVQIYNHHIVNSNSNYGAATIAAAAVPIHWGTFPLTTEPIMEPRELLLQYMRDNHQRQDHSIAATAPTVGGSFVPWLIGQTKRYLKARKDS